MSVFSVEVPVLPDIIKVVFIGNRKPSKRQLKRVLQVRRKKVMDALNCLKQTHELYKHIQLDHHLEMKLPEEDIPDSVWNTVTYYADSDADKEPHSTYVPTSAEDVLSETHVENEEDIILETSGVVDMEVTGISTAQHAAAAAVKKLQDSTLLYPHGSQPTVEYNNPQMWTGGYPYLFPYNMGGPEGQHSVPLSLSRWIQHLLHFHDPRFRTDHTFIFHVFNVLQKREVCIFCIPLINAILYMHVNRQTL